MWAHWTLFHSHFYANECACRVFPVSSAAQGGAHCQFFSAYIQKRQQILRMHICHLPRQLLMQSATMPGCSLAC